MLSRTRKSVSAFLERAGALHLLPRSCSFQTSTTGAEAGTSKPAGELGTFTQPSSPAPRPEDDKSDPSDRTHRDPFDRRRIGSRCAVIVGETFLKVISGQIGKVIIYIVISWIGLTLPMTINHSTAHAGSIGMTQASLLNTTQQVDISTEDELD